MWCLRVSRPRRNRASLVRLIAQTTVVSIQVAHALRLTQFVAAARRQASSNLHFCCPEGPQMAAVWTCR